MSMDSVLQALFAAQPQSLLLSLPPEIRLLIYDHLHDGDYISVALQRRYPSSRHTALCGGFAILLVCRQIHRELSARAYGESVFHLDLFKSAPYESRESYERLQQSNAGRCRRLVRRISFLRPDFGRLVRHLSVYDINFPIGLLQCGNEALRALSSTFPCVESVVLLCFADTQLVLAFPGLRRLFVVRNALENREKVVPVTEALVIAQSGLICEEVSKEWKRGETAFDHVKPVVSVYRTACVGVRDETFDVGVKHVHVVVCGVEEARSLRLLPWKNDCPEGDPYDHGWLTDSRFLRA